MPNFIALVQQTKKLFFNATSPLNNFNCQNKVWALLGVLVAEGCCSEACHWRLLYVLWKAAFTCKALRRMPRKKYVQTDHCCAAQIKWRETKLKCSICKNDVHLMNTLLVIAMFGEVLNYTALCMGTPARFTYNFSVQLCGRSHALIIETICVHFSATVVLLTRACHFAWPCTWTKWECEYVCVYKYQWFGLVFAAWTCLKSEVTCNMVSKLNCSQNMENFL